MLLTLLAIFSTTRSRGYCLLVEMTTNFSPRIASSRSHTDMAERLPQEVGETGVSRAPYGIELQWVKNYIPG